MFVYKTKIHTPISHFLPVCISSSTVLWGWCSIIDFKLVHVKTHVHIPISHLLTTLYCFFNVQYCRAGAILTLNLCLDVLADSIARSTSQWYEGAINRHCTIIYKKARQEVLQEQPRQLVEMICDRLPLLQVSGI